MADRLTAEKLRDLLLALEAAGPPSRGEKYSLIVAVLFAAMVGAAVGAVLTWRLIEQQAPRPIERPMPVEKPARGPRFSNPTD